MDPRLYITVVALYIGIYVLVLELAALKYFEQFPEEERCIGSGPFHAIERSIVVVGLLFDPDKTIRLSSPSAIFQFNLVRVMLGLLPVFSAVLFFFF
jgi:hypothetical protein